MLHCCNGLGCNVALLQWCKDCTSTIYAIVYSTFLVSKLGNFAYKDRHYFTAHNAYSVYQAKKALAIVYGRLSTLEQAHYR